MTLYWTNKELYLEYFNALLLKKAPTFTTFLIKRITYRTWKRNLVQLYGLLCCKEKHCSVSSIKNV